MQKMHKTIFINAPREKVWNTMLEDATYRDWTAAFGPGMYYKGSFEKGSKILFIGPSPVDGVEGGLVSHILENKPYEFVSMEHLGVVKNGVEDMEDESIGDWKGAVESYKFEVKDGGTELTVELDVSEKEKDQMEEMWDKGLQRLKEISEK